MNPFSETVWEVIQDSPEFLEQLQTIMRRDHRPFLEGEKAFQYSAKMLEGYIREELDKWYDWLPDSPVNKIAGGLAFEMLDCVDWDQVARLVQENILKASLSALSLPIPSSTV